jgi:hypothetical protein
VQQRQDLAPRPRGARASAEIDSLIDEPVDAEPLTKCDRQHDARVDDRAFIVETNIESVRRGVHHAGDLLTAGPGCPIQPKIPAQEVILRPATGQNHAATPVDRS